MAWYCDLWLSPVLTICAVVNAGVVGGNGDVYDWARSVHAAQGHSSQERCRYVRHWPYVSTRGHSPLNDNPLTVARQPRADQTECHSHDAQAGYTQPRVLAVCVLFMCAQLHQAARPAHASLFLFRCTHTAHARRRRTTGRGFSGVLNCLLVCLSRRYQILRSVAPISAPQGQSRRTLFTGGVA